MGRDQAGMEEDPASGALQLAHPDRLRAVHAVARLGTTSDEALARRRPLAIEDARETPLTSNRAVQDLGVVAYLGAPLEDPEGHVLGALCVIDRVSRCWDEASVALLQD